MSVVVERTFHIARRGGPRGGCRHEVRQGSEPPIRHLPTGRIPRIARLLALAIRCDRLLRSGAVTSLSDLARIAHVTQPRMTQILNLTLLAPDIQERLLLLDPIEVGRPAWCEKRLRRVCGMPLWQDQRRCLGLPPA